MSDAKKGLRLLSFSIILNIGWGIASAFLTGRVGDFQTYLPIVTLGILLLCYLIDFGGLRLAGHSNKNFKLAWKLKIVSLVLVIIAMIFAAISAKSSRDLTKQLGIFVMIVDIIETLNSILVIYLVVKGCAEISPRVKGLSKFASGLFFLQALLIIAMDVTTYIILKNDIVVADNPNHPVVIATVAIACVFAIAAILFAVSYILLIFRATANVGKSR